MDIVKNFSKWLLQNRNKYSSNNLDADRLFIFFFFFICHFIFPQTWSYPLSSAFEKIFNEGSDCKQLPGVRCQGGWPREWNYITDPDMQGLQKRGCFTRGLFYSINRNAWSAIISFFFFLLLHDPATSKHTNKNYKRDAIISSPSPSFPLSWSLLFLSPCRLSFLSCCLLSPAPPSSRRLCWRSYC